MVEILRDFTKRGMHFGINMFISMYQTNDKPSPRTHSRLLIVFSRIASFVFHPLFMTAVIAFAIYKLAPGDFPGFSFSIFRKWFGQLLLYTVLLPFLLIALFKVSGMITNARMHEARDRIPPLLATIVFYFLGYKFFMSHYQFPILF